MGAGQGVATFSVSQRKAIQDELEILRRLNPQYEDFFNSHPAEPFFIKNLENIQGDERDVIMISVGYARNKQGYLAMRFGPLGSQGGERRLNVLISRAKRRCEVFASITDEDIDLERAKGVGVLAFKLFLQICTYRTFINVHCFRASDG
ncbi:putative superfamily I DNA and RNA helicase protein [Enterobacter cloacae]|uniref:Putative superfamily I DNA and RNA helicase protein n=1 Tax=Enterobacter cloacae TaxID=550 RepID=A0A377LQQ7_ENTCL|nr:putative superfamily I DNA and RNA helicase protein [Enterobacter cloacae]